MDAGRRLEETYEQMLREKLPNLFRLYLNPYVVGTCLCLERMIHISWQTSEPYQSFLANSFDEALSGAIKLARYAASVTGKPSQGLVIDRENRLESFASSGDVVFLPGLTIVRSAASADASFGFVVEVGSEPVATSALRVVCTDRAALVHRRTQPSASPDIVVFDESFVCRDVPFGAFAARKSLYDHWNRPGKSTFHSTTFQPNTVSTLHFMSCLERDDPECYAQIAADLRRLEDDPALRLKLLRRLYSPSLANAIAATGCDTPDVRAEGHYVFVDGRKIFDGVGGVACSVRGHNPPTYAEEIADLADVDCAGELKARLHASTGLPNLLPAVSGASAVENALKLVLVAQSPRKHVLALKSGFGGKTLLALAGTWNSSYKQHLDPLYAEVLYVDPFADDAVMQIEAILRTTPVAVVHMELIQGVGGVRRVPEAIVRHLDAARPSHGFLLLIDEVQTGMFRTGPFTLSRAMGVTPDLLAIGKAVSDMMIPFAVTLYSQQLQQKLTQLGSTLPECIRDRYSYPIAYQTALNALRFAEKTGLAERVAESGAAFARRLVEELATCKAVRAVRVFGLLIGIELDASRWPQRWFAKRLFWFYLSAMLQHPRFPVLVGFCQYEPNVLKITPPLTTDADEIRQICATIGDVLRRPFYRLLISAVGGMWKSFGLGRKKHAVPESPAPQPVSH